MRVTAENVGSLSDEEIDSMLAGESRNISSIRSMLHNSALDKMSIESLLEKARQALPEAMHDDREVLHNLYIDKIYYAKVRDFITQLETSQLGRLSDQQLACSLLQLRYDAEKEFLSSYS